MRVKTTTKAGACVPMGLLLALLGLATACSSAPSGGTADLPRSSTPADGTAVFRGTTSRELRGWTASGKVLVVVQLPMPTRTNVALHAYRLGRGDVVLGSCVGIVPPAQIRGGATGVCNQIRDGAPLPVAGLRTVKAHAMQTGSTNINIKDFFYPFNFTECLVVGGGLTMTPAGDGEFVVADPATTYALTSDGWRLTTEHEGSGGSGIKVPLRVLPLLFVVDEFEPGPLDVRDDEGTITTVDVAGLPGSGQ